eukprot:918320-Ditylum_brightwellii.AAC.1
MTKSKASNAAAYSKTEKPNKSTTKSLSKVVKGKWSGGEVSINTRFKASNNKKEHPKDHDVHNQDGGS